MDINTDIDINMYININNFYNTSVQVKYYDIKQELIQKLNLLQETEYSFDDIETICSKIYMDELSNAFNADNVYDDKIDKTLYLILEKWNKNINLKQILEDTKKLLPYQNGSENDLYIMWIFLSENLFHITHKIICEYFINDNISENLLKLFRQHIMQVFLN